MPTTSYFNPDQHLVFQKDKNGQMMSGGYKINNALFEQNIPLFSKWSGGSGGGTAGASAGGDNDGVSANIIPEKFSDLFRDLAVPAGLFIMPPLFSSRKYMLEKSDEDKNENKTVSHEYSDSDDANTDDDGEEHAVPRHKFAPVDLFDKLIALVTPTERIKLDNKTRKHRPRSSSQNKKEGITKRSKPSRSNKYKYKNKQ